MTTATLALLAMYAPSPKMLAIAFFAACIPVTFFFCLRSWLGAVKEENPEEAERAQAKADEEHLAHHGGAHSHGKGHAHS